MSDNNTDEPVLGVHGIPCIGPCYDKGVSYLHPVTLKYVRKDKYSSCPTLKWFDNTKNSYRTSDKCVTKNTNKNDLLNPVYPSYNFIETEFLKTFYNISSFSTALIWLNNNINNYYSSLRVIECLFRIYGKSSKKILEDDFITYYTEFIKIHNIEYFYENFMTYFSINNNLLTFSNVINSNTKIKKYKKDIINYINNKIITFGNIHKIIHNYFNKNLSNWYSIQCYNSDFLSYIIVNIIDSLKK